MTLLLTTTVLILLQHQIGAAPFAKNWQAKDYSACIAEVGVEKYSFAELERFQQLPEDNAVLNKVLGCSWKKLGIIGANSHVNLDKLETFVLNLVPDFEAMSENELVKPRDVAEHCAELGGSTVGQRVVRIVNCINWYLEDMQLPQN